MPERTRRRRWIGPRSLRAGRIVTFALAAMGLCQLPVCFPDPIGAVNFELQNLITTTLIRAFDIVVRNLLGL
ncbi:MAG: hypothetical protein ACE5F9_14470 [Phycisphaerae bacterium]